MTSFPCILGHVWHDTTTIKIQQVKFQWPVCWIQAGSCLLNIYVLRILTKSGWTPNLCSQKKILNQCSVTIMCQLSLVLLVQYLKPPQCPISSRSHRMTCFPVCFAGADLSCNLLLHFCPTSQTSQTFQLNPEGASACLLCSQNLHCHQQPFVSNSSSKLPFFWPAATFSNALSRKQVPFEVQI